MQHQRMNKYIRGHWQKPIERKLKIDIVCKGAYVYKNQGYIAKKFLSEFWPCFRTIRRNLPSTRHWSRCRSLRHKHGRAFTSERTCVEWRERFWTARLPTSHNALTRINISEGYCFVAQAQKKSAQDTICAKTN